MTNVLKDKIKAEINGTPFISIQADNTLDNMNCKSQMSITVRHCMNDRMEERFLNFDEVSKDKTAVRLS